MVNATNQSRVRYAPLCSALLLVVPLGCCKSKSGEKDDYVPPPQKAYSMTTLKSLCDDGRPYAGNPAYEKKSVATTPSKVAVFRKYLDDKVPAYKEDEHEFGAIGAKSGDAGSVELVACVELKRKGDPLFCNYYGSTIKIFDMTHKVKVLEVATGKVVSEHEFELDRRTEKCPSSAAGSSFRGTDYSSKLLSLLLPLEPEGVELPKIKSSDLDAVCSGGAFPQAAPLASGGRRPLHLVYFPTEEKSFSRVDLPKGLELKDPKEEDASQVQLVACVTGKPQKKKRACKFMGGNVLELSEGEFEVVVREASTGKVVETKTFRGTSGACPGSYKFFGRVDKIMTQIAPDFRAYIKKLEGS